MKTMKIKTVKLFTLVELLAAMGVFSVLMFILISFFASSQKAWTSSVERTMVYQNARIAMDLIARDLQCAYYENGKIPFWHWRPSDRANPPFGSWGEYANEFIAFISATSSPPNDDCVSRLCEVKYQKYYDTSTDHSKENDGWLRRSATGDKHSGAANKNYGFYNNFTVGYKTNDDTSAGYPDAVFTVQSSDSAFPADPVSSMAYQKVIPYVTKLEFECYKRDGTVIPPDTTVNVGNDALAGAPYSMTFPYSVTVSLWLMDKVSWDKWVALRVPATDTNPYSEDAGGSGTTESRIFRIQHERKFTKTILLGERGQ